MNFINDGVNKKKDNFIGNRFLYKFVIFLYDILQNSYKIVLKIMSLK